MAGSPFSAVLLAGGKSTRMGRDKAFLEINGEPLWRRQLRTLAALQPRELFIAGPAREEWPNVIADAPPNAGPLGGVVAALQRCTTPLLVVLAVDLPEMTSAYLRSLLDASTDRCGVVPREQPLAGVYPVWALPFAEECLSTGRYAMREFLQQCSDRALVRQIPTTPIDEPLFVNLNSPADLARV